MFPNDIPELQWVVSCISLYYLFQLPMWLSSTKNLVPHCHLAVIDPTQLLMQALFKQSESRAQPTNYVFHHFIPFRFDKEIMQEPFVQLDGFVCRGGRLIQSLRAFRVSYSVRCAMEDKKWNANSV